MAAILSREGVVDEFKEISHVMSIYPDNYPMTVDRASM